MDNNNPRIIFQDKETLKLYIGACVLYMKDQDWDSPEHFYDLIEEWINRFHKDRAADPGIDPE